MPRGGEWRRIPAKDRILSFVDKTDDGHWMWTGSRCGLHREYGQTSLNGARVTAHRGVWMVLGNPLPRELDLLHQCGQTLCVNPAHLQPGTHAENLRQAVAARNGVHWAPRGEQHSKARLTQAQVDDIRVRYRAGERQAVLSAEYGVAQPNISYIVNNKRWRMEVQGKKTRDDLDEAQVRQDEASKRADVAIAEMGRLSDARDVVAAEADARAEHDWQVDNKRRSADDNRRLADDDRRHADDDRRAEDDVRRRDQPPVPSPESSGTP